MVSIRTTEVVYNGLNNPIRKLPLDQSELAISGIIMKCALVYSGMQQSAILDAIIETCTEFILQHFGNLGLHEIEEAFKLAAAGKISADMRAYYGRFTCGILGDVLTAYYEERKHAVAAIRDAEEQIERQAAEEAKKIALNADAQKYAIEHFHSSVWDSWQQVPVHYYDILHGAGLLQYTDEEKLEIWQQACAICQEEIQNGAFQDANHLHKERCCRILKGIAKGGRHEEAAKEERNDWAKVTYTKLLIFKKSGDE